MFWLAALLAVIAVLCFLLEAFAPGVPRKIHAGYLGLAFLTVAWMVQIIFVAVGGRLTVS